MAPGHRTQDWRESTVINLAIDTDEQYQEEAPIYDVQVSFTTRRTLSQLTPVALQDHRGQNAVLRSQQH
jgi:hypothetical protein